MTIVLVEPQIPQNTGNVARTCVCTGTRLILCEPMGFVITESRVKRAGLDYWPALDLAILPGTRQLFEMYPNGPFWFFSSKGTRVYTDAQYEPDSLLVFGSETSGLPDEIRRTDPERCVRIPMQPGQRCLNLSNAVCTGLYEAMRQNGFPGLK